MDVKGRLIEMADGSYVESDVLRVVHTIQDYDPNLVVKYMDPHKAGLTDAPYAIFERCPDGLERLVFSAWTLDDRVIERVYAADNQRHKVLDRIDRNNDRVRLNSQRRYQEKMAEAHDIFASVLRSPKGTYSFEVEGNNGTTKKVTVDDSGPSKVEIKGD